MHLIMVIILSLKKLAQEFEGKFTCLGKNTGKCINVSVQTEKNLQELVKMVEKLEKHIFLINIHF